MKYLFKISCLFLGMLMFVFACEQEPKQLSTVEDIFPSDIDTVGVVRPQALRTIPGSSWRLWRLSDTTFAIMSQDTSNNLESIIREDSLMAWIRSWAPDSLNLTQYLDNDTIYQTLSISNDSLYISDGNSVLLTAYLDNTDAQTLSISNDTLFITGGNGVSLAAYVGGAGSTDTAFIQSEISDSLLYLYRDGNWNFGHGYNLYGQFNSGAQYNVAGGYEALRGNFSGGISGDYNIGFGYRAGISMSSGNTNILMGRESAFDMTTGSNNVFLGYRSGYESTTSTNSVLLGRESGRDHLDHSKNVIIGYQAGLSTADDNVTILGAEAGQNIGFNSIVIGFQAGKTNTLDNRLIIDNRDSDVNSFIYGDMGNDILNLNTEVIVRDNLYFPKDYSDDFRKWFSSADGYVSLVWKSATRKQVITPIDGISSIRWTIDSVSATGNWVLTGADIYQAGALVKRIGSTASSTWESAISYRPYGETGYEFTGGTHANEVISSVVFYDEGGNVITVNSADSVHTSKAIYQIVEGTARHSETSTTDNMSFVFVKKFEGGKLNVGYTYNFLAGAEVNGHLVHMFPLEESTMTKGIVANDSFNLYNLNQDDDLGYGKVSARAVVCYDSTDNWAAGLVIKDYNLLDNFQKTTQKAYIEDRSTLNKIYFQRLTQTDSMEIGDRLRGNAEYLIRNIPNIDNMLVNGEVINAYALEVSPSIPVMPNLTTTQRNAVKAVNGMMIFNTTDNQIQGYENGSWVDL